MAQIMYNLPYNFCQTFITISDLSGMYDWVKDYVQTEDMSAYTGVPTKAAAIIGSAAATYLSLEYFGGGQCTSSASMKGKTCLITGCNTGIGKETARDLSRRGAKVIMACRNLDLAEKAAEDIRKTSEGEIVVKKLDLANLASIHAFAQEFNITEERLDVLINNAGVMWIPQKTHTADGFESTIGVNHLGHFLLTNLLLDKLRASKPARIVNVSSRAHTRGQMDLNDINFATKPWNPMTAYEQSKLANVLFSRQLVKMLNPNEVCVYSLHPGVVRTDLGRHIEDKIGVFRYVLWGLLWPFTKNPVQGAQTTIHCAVSEELEGETGLYYSDCSPQEAAPLAQNDETAEKLWELSSKLVGM